MQRVYRVLVSELPKKGTPVRLSETEAHHLVRVLRARPGDSLEVLDGRGGRCAGRLAYFGSDSAVEWQGELARNSKRSSYPIILEVGILKGDAMEWVVEKAVELGVDRLIPVLCERSVVRLSDTKGPEFFQSRWQRIANQALKQCERPTSMEVSRPLRLQEIDLTASRILALERDEALPPLLQKISSVYPLPERLHFLSGPEGGFTDAEKLFLAAVPAVSLGDLILRAETAAIFGASVLSAFFCASFTDIKSLDV